MTKKIDILFLGVFWGALIMAMIYSVGDEIPTHTNSWGDFFQGILFLGFIIWMGIETYKVLKSSLQ